MILQQSRRQGFTIVELLVVIVVIGILATLVVIAYGGIQRQAQVSVLQSDLSNALKHLENAKTSSPSEQYPSSSDGLPRSPGTFFQYTYDDELNQYCLSATTDAAGVSGYHISSTDRDIVEGVCVGHAGPGETPIEDADSIAAGNGITCVVQASTGYCWGTNNYGQLGIGSTTNALNPQPLVTSGVLSGKSVTNLGPSRLHSCGLADGQAYCWGRGGWLGDGTPSGGSYSSPVEVTTSGVLSGKTVNSLTMGDNSACVLASGASIHCWGGNTYGQLGNGTTTASTLPVNPDTSGVLSGRTITAIDAGAYHVCVIASGDAYCWGYNAGGQVGNSTSASPQSTPVAVTKTGVLSGKTVTAISGGSAFTCAIADEAAYCWGSNSSGQLGRGNNTSSNSPATVLTSGVLSGKAIDQLATGQDSACALADGEVYCWGANGYGQLGNGNTTNSNAPVAVSTAGVLSGKTVTAISGDGYHYCATAGGEFFCWGHNSVGQLGNGNTTNSSVPVAVTALP